MPLEQPQELVLMFLRSTLVYCDAPPRPHTLLPVLVVVFKQCNVKQLQGC
jgi:hypothetical protein